MRTKRSLAGEQTCPSATAALHPGYALARTRAQEAEENLGLPEPVSLGSIHGHLEKFRARKIVVKPMPGTPTDTVCGLWFGLDSLDVIFHAPAASAVHRQQIILHEFAHMILRHEQERVSPEYAQTFFPGLDPARVVKALKRTDFMNEFEITAELLADRLAARVRRSQQRAGGQPANFGRVFG